MSTDISYKYGETKERIQFPLVTLCNLNIFLNDSTIKECNDGSWSFISILFSCMKNNKPSKVADVMQNPHPEIRNIVEKVQFWTGSEYVNVNHGSVWTKVFHKSYGPCYTFDVSKIEKFKYVSIKAVQRPAIEFVMPKTIAGKMDS